MPRNMSFALTTAQFLNKTKDVTRRLGWDFLQPGDLLWAVKKAMGLRKGEKIKRLGLIEVVSVTVEPLDAITKEDVVREGFPKWSPEQFVDFFSSHNDVPPDTIVNRIEFRHLEREEDALEAEEVRHELAEFRLHTEKTRKEIARIDVAVKQAQLSLDIYRGQYVPRSQLAGELASQASVLGKQLEGLFQDCLPEVISLVGGNQQKAPNLLAYLLRKKTSLLTDRPHGGR